MSADSLFYPIADALQTTLNVCKGGDFVGERKHVMALGPWQAEDKAKVVSDEVSQDCTSVFWQVRSNLWGYMISDQMGHRLRTVFFDASLAKVQYGDVSTVKTGKTASTLKLLKPAIVGAFRWDNAKWREHSIADITG